MIVPDLTNIYQVNKELKDDIFSRIPKDFTKLEQALFIYNELCQKLNYSLEYYLDEHRCYPFFTNAQNIEKIDGKLHKDVVCFTFDRIFLKLLYDRNIITKEDFWENASYSIMFNHIYPEHNIMDFMIDGQRFTVDATMGAFKDSDLSQSKFAGYEITGWTLRNHSTDEQAKNFQKALEKIQNLSVNKQLQDDVLEYLKTKYKKEKMQKYSLDSRAKLYMQFVSEYGHYQELKSISFSHKLKNLMFTSDESKIYPDERAKISIKLIYNKKKDCASILLFYNVEEELKVYQLDLVEPKAICQKTTVQKLKHGIETEDLKYLSISKTIDEMVKPVEMAIKLCEQGKNDDETRTV